MSGKKKKKAAEQAGVTASGLSALRLMANWAIAGASLAVIAGFVYWTVNLGTRDPHEVPIIRAMEGPSRVAPDDPGGRTASHQGLAVNSVQSEGTVEAPAREVVLAPAPEQPAEEDTALGAVKEVTPTKVSEPAIASPAVALVAPDAPQKSEEDLDALEIADSVAEAVAQRELADSDPAMVPSANIRGTDISPRRSLRPKGRPQVLRTEVSNVERTASASTTEVAGVDTVAIGTRLIQLGAYDTADLAQSEWNKLLSKHSDLLEDKKRLVIEAESGGRKFYRLRAAGFNSLEESRSLCSALLARGTPCIPVTAR